MTTRWRLLQAGLLAMAVLSLSPAALAQEQEPDLSEINSEEFIRDIEATIADIDAGTATTESAVETTIRLEADVFFDFDQDRLRPDAQSALTDVAQQIREDGATQLQIGGHTDSVGDDAYNQALSERRAAAVEAFLGEQLGGVRTSAQGFGDTQPIAPNETESGEDNPEGRAQNRRVEITYPQ